MPVLVRANIDRTSGVVQLRFPYHPETIETVKEIPGTKWNEGGKFWTTSLHGLAALQALGLNILPIMESEFRAEIPSAIANRLRPYQIEGAYFGIMNSGALLTMDPRTGKTPTAIAVVTALMTRAAVQGAVFVYPANVRHVWQQELKKWANCNLFTLEGTTPLTDRELQSWSAVPYLMVGCHYEILSKRIADIHALMMGKQFILVGDEIHLCKNRKSRRWQDLETLTTANRVATIGVGERREQIATGICTNRLGLTGTPMRNRPRDMYCLFEFAQPGSMGGYWTYAKRYCDAAPGDYGWVDSGSSNEEELALRLSTISYRKTRAEVAGYLPKSEITTIVCSLPEPQAKTYRKLEKHLATSIRRGLSDAEPTLQDRSALEQLAAATSEGKIPVAIERAYDHTFRGVKVLIFANFHETLKSLDKQFDLGIENDIKANGQQTLPPHFTAGGWMTPEKRKKVIEQWKACPGPAILLVNAIASGVGIDLSEADVAIGVEPVWVPADMLQIMARIVDVHQGKRTTPPLYEFLMVKDTVDEAMLAALLEKIRNIENVVGKDAETGGLANALRNAGVVGPARLGLSSKDDDTVNAALDSLFERLGEKPSGDNSESLAADAAEAFAEDEEEAA